ncbi:MAG TPA: hypothetical protein VFZ16_19610 [Hyphomicrobiaceae bacterium]|nr:hypothetical protein [Hyphomicrobiaceae bacterium]
MAETTQLVMAGKKMAMPRFLKRLVQAGLGVALTSAVFFAMIVGNGLLIGRATTLQSAYNAWLAFIRRPDILTTMVLTAVVTVLLLYWQRDQERRPGGRP